MKTHKDSLEPIPPTMMKVGTLVIRPDDDHPDVQRAYILLEVKAYDTERYWLPPEEASTLRRCLLYSPHDGRKWVTAFVGNNN